MNVTFALRGTLVALIVGSLSVRVPARDLADGRIAVVQRSDKAQVERALAAYNARVAAMSHDSVAATYTADGEMGEAGQPPTRGREAIRARLASFSSYKVLANRLVADSTTVVADTARQWGQYWQRVRVPAGDTIEARGKFSVTWLRTGGGVWQIRRMIATPQR